MKGIKYKLLVFALTLGVFTSCTDYLTEVNPNEQSSGNYWRNLTETGSTLTGAYSVFMNHYVLGLVEEGARADYGWPGYGRPVANPRDVDLAWYNQTYNNSTQYVESKWNASYTGIFRANQVIQGLQGLESDFGGNEEEWTSQMAQARFIRGILHFWLYNSYNGGSIILRDKVAQDYTEIAKGLSPAKEVLAFIREDLKYAKENLLTTYEYEGSATLGRATPGAAATALGMSFLFEGDYVNASPLFDEVINNYGYKLAQPEDLWTGTGEFNSESIFEVVYSLAHRPELGQWDEQSLHNRLAQMTNGYSLPPVWIIHAFSNEKMDAKDDRNYYIDNEGTRRLRNVPLRCSASVNVVNDEQTPYYITDNATENGQYTWNGWGFGGNKKYKNHDTREGSETGAEGENLNGWRSGKNVVVMRLSEVILMQAECKLLEGGVSNSLALINKIRARWGLVLLGPSNGDASHTYDEVAYDQETLKERLMHHEKPLEMYFEGNQSRWIDLRRWNETGERFKDLANRVYYAVNYEYTKLDDDDNEVEGTKEFALVVDYKPSGDYKIIDYEYKNPALNYNSTIHDWFPIPQGEINKNPDISK